MCWLLSFRGITPVSIPLSTMEDTSSLIVLVSLFLYPHIHKINSSFSFKIVIWSEALPILLLLFGVHWLSVMELCWQGLDIYNISKFCWMNRSWGVGEWTETKMQSLMRYQHWTLQNVFVRVAEEWVYGTLDIFRELTHGLMKESSSPHLALWPGFGGFCAMLCYVTACFS